MFIAIYSMFISLDVDIFFIPKGANVDARDYSGRRPKDYLKRNAMPSVKSTFTTSFSLINR